MARQEINMPRIGPFMEQGMLAKWNVAVGDHVEMQDVIAQVEIEKMETEMESIYAGTITELIGVEGETYEVGAILGYMDEDEL